MERFPQFLSDIKIDDEEHDNSLIKPFDASWDTKEAVCKEANTMNVSSSSFPISSSSSNSEFDSNFQVSSTPD